MLFIAKFYSSGAEAVQYYERSINQSSFQVQGYTGEVEEESHGKN